MHNWRWSEEEPFPPIQYVLTAALYGDEYRTLIERLKKPVPQIVITESSEKTYITLDTSTAEITEGDVDSEKYDPFSVSVWDLLFHTNCLMNIVCRSGLIHINNGEPGAAVSSDLRNLSKIMAVAELADGAHELHGVLQTAITTTYGGGDFSLFDAIASPFPQNITTPMLLAPPASSPGRRLQFGLR